MQKEEKRRLAEDTKRKEKEARLMKWESNVKKKDDAKFHVLSFDTTAIFKTPNIFDRLKVSGSEVVESSSGNPPPLPTAPPSSPNQNENRSVLPSEEAKTEEVVTVHQEVAKPEVAIPDTQTRSSEGASSESDLAQSELDLSESTEESNKEESQEAPKKEKPVPTKRTSAKSSKKPAKKALVPQKTIRTASQDTSGSDSTGLVYFLIT